MWQSICFERLGSCRQAGRQASRQKPTVLDSPFSLPFSELGIVCFSPRLLFLVYIDFTFVFSVAVSACLHPTFVYP